MSAHDEASHLDCSEALYRMMQFVDGELPGTDADAIAEHLGTCAPCLAEHDMDQMVKQLVRRAEPCCSAPPQLRTTILQQITTIAEDGSYTQVTRRVTYEE